MEEGEETFNKEAENFAIGTEDLAAKTGEDGKAETGARGDGITENITGTDMDGMEIDISIMGRAITRHSIPQDITLIQENFVMAGTGRILSMILIGGRESL